MRIFSLSILMLLLGMFSLSSCSKISEEGYDYYQNRSTEDLVKMASYDVWLELYGEEPLIKKKDCKRPPETVEITYKGRYLNYPADDGGIICNQEYPNETCYKIIIVNPQKKYQMIYGRYSTEITEL